MIIAPACPCDSSISAENCRIVTVLEDQMHIVASFGGAAEDQRGIGGDKIARGSTCIRIDGKRCR